MNNTLSTLANAYLDQGTGSIMLYYSMEDETTGVVGSGGEFTGVIMNVPPSSTVGHTGLVIDATGATEAEAGSKLEAFFLNEKSGVDLSFSSIKFDTFANEGFMSPDDLETEISFLFSFEKIQRKNGVLFGNLNKETFNDGEVSFNYGKGFNIGINDRNKLFFQGIDSEIGEYVLVADNLELANKNICSATVSPFQVSFSLYNLADDDFQTSSLRTDSKIENIEYTGNFYIGKSDHYIREGSSFSGYLDQFMMITGVHGASDLKSLASGFVATGSPVSGASYIDTVITGSEVTLVSPVGITGYQAVITGFQEIMVDSELIEFTLIQNEFTPLTLKDGDKFITGYTLPNNSGAFVEETAFLIPENNYTDTGDDAHATLGLTDGSNVVTDFTLQSSKIVKTTGTLPLYGVSGVTGFLVGEPTGYLKTFLTQDVLRTGSLIENLIFKEGYVEQYKHDYLHYLSTRI